MQQTDQSKESKAKQGDKRTRRQKRNEEKQQSTKQPLRRIFPIWLRIIVIFLLSFLALIVGMIVGFSVLGDGEPLDVLQFEFWQHVLDIITGVE